MSNKKSLSSVAGEDSKAGEQPSRVQPDMLGISASPLEDRILLAADGFELSLELGTTDLATDKLTEPAQRSTTSNIRDIIRQFDLGPAVTIAEEAQELVVIDTRVDNYQDIARQLGPNFAVLIVEPNQDAVSQIKQYLATSGAAKLNAIHIISHGSPGQMLLGDRNYDLRADTADLAHLQQLQGVFNQGADWLFYGCDFAEGSIGEQAMARLAAGLGLDIAASDDKTGAATAGGDLELERQVGAIEHQLINVQSLRQYQGTLSSVDLTDRYRSSLVATQSSSDSSGNFPASKAVDGSYGGAAGQDSAAVTDGGQMNHWWQLNLSNPYELNSITVVARGDNGESLNGAVVKVLNANNVVIYTSAAISGAYDNSRHHFDLGSLAAAQYIRVERSGQGELALQEVIAYGQDPDPATVTTLVRSPPTNQVTSEDLTNKYRSVITATQSSTIVYHGISYPAENAIDDNNTGLLAHTDPNRYPAWWELDLKRSFNITKVVIYNRTDNLGTRLNGAIVNILDEQRNVIASSAPISGASRASVESFYPNNIASVAARYIRIDHANNMLNLAEVRAFGYDDNDITDQHRSQLRATQSSTVSSSQSADRAVDGSFASSSSSGTSSSATAPHWWELDLGLVADIEGLLINNITPSSNNHLAARLNGAIVKLLDAHRNVIYTSAPITGASSGSVHNLTIYAADNRVRARYIRIEQPNATYTHNGVTYQSALDLNEVRVFGGNEQDLLTEKYANQLTASQSSTLGTQSADKALDRDLTGSSYSSTASGTAHWWQLDFNRNVDIAEIILFNRTGASNIVDQLNGAIIKILDANGNVLFTSAPIQGAHSGSIHTFTPSTGPLSERGTVSSDLWQQARFVRIETDSATLLHFYELAVYGKASNLDHDLTRRYRAQISASQSSTSGAGSEAANAINGAFVYAESQTNSAANNWWELDFAGLASLTEIIINNTTANGSRLNGVVLKVLDADRNTLYTSSAISGASNGSSHTFKMNGLLTGARYIRLEKAQSGQLQLHQVIAYGTVVAEPNIDLTATHRSRLFARQSSDQSSNTGANLAVDGVYGNNTGTDGSQTTHWWEFNFAGLATISDITIFNHDENGENLEGAIVKVLDVDGNVLFTGTITGADDGSRHNFAMPNLSLSNARTIRVELNRSASLRLQEVVVYGSNLTSFYETITISSVDDSSGEANLYGTHGSEDFFSNPPAVDVAAIDDMFQHVNDEANFYAVFLVDEFGQIVNTMNLLGSPEIGGANEKYLWAKYNIAADNTGGTELLAYMSQLMQIKDKGRHNYYLVAIGYQEELVESAQTDIATLYNNALATRSGFAYLQLHLDRPDPVADIMAEVGTDGKVYESQPDFTITWDSSADIKEGDHLILSADGTPFVTLTLAASDITAGQIVYDNNSTLSLAVGSTVTISSLVVRNWLDSNYLTDINNPASGVMQSEVEVVRDTETVTIPEITDGSGSITSHQGLASSGFASSSSPPSIDYSVINNLFQHTRDAASYYAVLLIDEYGNIVNSQGLEGAPAPGGGDEEYLWSRYNIAADGSGGVDLKAYAALQPLDGEQHSYYLVVVGYQQEVNGTPADSQALYDLIKDSATGFAYLYMYQDRPDPVATITVVGLSGGKTDAEQPDLELSWGSGSDIAVGDTIVVSHGSNEVARKVLTAADISANQVTITASDYSNDYRLPPSSTTLTTVVERGGTDSNYLQTPTDPDSGVAQAEVSFVVTQAPITIASIMDSTGATISNDGVATAVMFGNSGTAPDIDYASLFTGSYQPQYLALFMTDEYGNLINSNDARGEPEPSFAARERVHWVKYNMNADGSGGVEGRNAAGGTGYLGLTARDGQLHPYYIVIYGYDATITPASDSAQDIYNAVQAVSAAEARFYMYQDRPDPVATITVVGLMGGKTDAEQPDLELSWGSSSDIAVGDTLVVSHGSTEVARKVVTAADISANQITITASDYSNDYRLPPGSVTLTTVVERGGTDSNYLQIPTDPDSGVAQAEVSFVVTQAPLTIASIMDSTGATIPNDGVATVVMFGNSGTAPDIDYASLFTGSYQPQYLALFMTDEYGNLINSNDARGEPEPSFAARERVHWVKYNMNADGSGGVEGRNAAGGTGYLGLSARDGQLHPYYIVIYGYDATITPASDSAQDIYNAVQAVSAAEARFYMYQDRPDPVATITVVGLSGGKTDAEQPDLELSWGSGSDIAVGDTLVVSHGSTEVARKVVTAADISANQITITASDYSNDYRLPPGSVTLITVVERGGTDSNYLQIPTDPDSGVAQAEVSFVVTQAPLTIASIMDSTGTTIPNDGVATAVMFGNSGTAPDIDYASLFTGSYQPQYLALFMTDEYGNLINSNDARGEPEPSFAARERVHWVKYNMNADGSGGVEGRNAAGGTGYLGLSARDGQLHPYYIVIYGYDATITPASDSAQDIYNAVQAVSAAEARFYMYQDRPDPVTTITVVGLSGGKTDAEQPDLELSWGSGSDIAVGDTLVVSHGSTEVARKVLTAADISANQITITASDYINNYRLSPGSVTLTTVVERNGTDSNYLQTPTDPTSGVAQAEVSFVVTQAPITIASIMDSTGAIIPNDGVATAVMFGNSGTAPDIDYASLFTGSYQPQYLALFMTDEYGNLINSNAARGEPEPSFAARERVHWVKYNMNADGSGGVEGRNAAGGTGYLGLTARDGQLHPYYIVIYGYDATVTPTSDSAQDIYNAVKAAAAAEARFYMYQDRPDPVATITVVGLMGGKTDAEQPDLELSWGSGSDIAVGDTIVVSHGSTEVARKVLTAADISANQITITASDYSNDYRLPPGSVTLTTVVERGGTDSNYLQTPTDPNSGVAQAEVSFVVTQTALTIASIRDSTGATIPNDGVATAVMFGNSGTAPDIDYASLFTGSYQPQYLALFMTDEYGNLINSNAARGEPEPSFAARERVHWVKYNMNPDGSGGVEGRNAAGGTGYLGLSARDGQLHPYYIVIYGYDATVTPASDSAQDIYNAVKAAAAAEARFYMYQDRPDPVATITAEVGADGKVYESQPDFTITWDSSADIKAGDHLILSADGTPFVTLTLAASDITAGQIVYDNNSTLSLAVGSTVTISSLVVRDGFDSNYLTDLNNPASGVMQSEVEVVRDTETVTIPEITDGSGSITSHQGLASSGFASSSSPPSIDYSVINNLFQHTRDAASYYAVLLIDEYGNIINSQGLEGAPAPGGGDEEYLWSRYNIAADGSGGVDLKAYAALQPPDGEQHSYYLVVVGYQQQVNSTPADSQALYDLIKDSATGFAYLYMYQDRPDPVATITVVGLSGGKTDAEQPDLELSWGSGSDIAVGDTIVVSHGSTEVARKVLTAADISANQITITASDYSNDYRLPPGSVTLTTVVERGGTDSNYLQTPTDPTSGVAQAEVSFVVTQTALTIASIRDSTGATIPNDGVATAVMFGNSGTAPDIDYASLFTGSYQPQYLALFMTDEYGNLINSNAARGEPEPSFAARERVHWVKYNMNADGSGGVEGRNAAGGNGYLGLSARDGQLHPYYIVVYGYDATVTPASDSAQDIYNAVKAAAAAEARFYMYQDRPDPVATITAEVGADGKVYESQPDFTITWDSSADIKAGDHLILSADGTPFVTLTLAASDITAGQIVYDNNSTLSLAVGSTVTISSLVVRDGFDSNYLTDLNNPASGVMQSEVEVVRDTETVTIPEITDGSGSITSHQGLASSGFASSSSPPSIDYSAINNLFQHTRDAASYYAVLLIDEYGNIVNSQGLEGAPAPGGGDEEYLWSRYNIAADGSGGVDLKAYAALQPPDGEQHSYYLVVVGYQQQVNSTPADSQALYDLIKDSATGFAYLYMYQDRPDPVATITVVGLSGGKTDAEQPDLELSWGSGSDIAVGDTIVVSHGSTEVARKVLTAADISANQITITASDYSNDYRLPPGSVTLTTVVERGGTDSNYLQTPTDPTSGVAQAEVSFVVTQTALTIASIRDSTGATIPNDGVATAVMFGNSGTAPDIDYASLFTGSYQPQYLALFMTDEYGNLINSNAARGEPEPSFAARERVHWVKYNMNADGSGGVEGRNAAGGNGYLGLSARDGQLHPYYIVVYGYDATVTPASDSAQDIYNAVKAAAAAEARFYMYQDRPDPVATITAEVGADGKVYESQPDFTITWDSSADIKAGDHLILSADGTPFVTLTLAASDITAGQIVYDNNSTLSLAVGSTVTISSLVVRDGFDSNYLTDLNNPASGVMQSEVEVVRDTETVTIPEITDGSGSITSHQGLASSGFASSSSPPSIDYSAINNLFQHTRDAASYYAVLLIDEYGNIVNSQGLEGAPAPGGGDEEYLWSRYNIAADGSGGVDLKAYAALQPPDGEQHSYYLVVVGYQQQVNSTPADSQALYDLIKDSATGFAYLYMYQDRPDPVATITVVGLSGGKTDAEQPDLELSWGSGSDIAVGDTIVVSHGSNEVARKVLTAADISANQITITASDYSNDYRLPPGSVTLTTVVERGGTDSNYLQTPTDPNSGVAQAEVSFVVTQTALTIASIRDSTGATIPNDGVATAVMFGNSGTAPDIDYASLFTGSYQPQYLALFMTDEYGNLINSNAARGEPEPSFAARERVHWVKYNMNADGSGGVEGRNAAGGNGYLGLSARDGQLHPYYIVVYGYDATVTPASDSAQDIYNAVKAAAAAEARFYMYQDRPDPVATITAEVGADGKVYESQPDFTITWDSSADIKAGDHLILSADGTPFVTLTLAASDITAGQIVYDNNSTLSLAVGSTVTISSLVVRDGFDSNYLTDLNNPASGVMQSEVEVVRDTETVTIPEITDGSGSITSHQGLASSGFASSSSPPSIDYSAINNLFQHTRDAASYYAVLLIDEYGNIVNSQGLEGAPAPGGGDEEYLWSRYNIAADGSGGVDLKAYAALQPPDGEQHSYYLVVVGYQQQVNSTPADSQALYDLIKDSATGFAYLYMYQDRPDPVATITVVGLSGGKTDAEQPDLELSWGSGSDIAVGDTIVVSHGSNEVARKVLTAADISANQITITASDYSNDYRLPPGSVTLTTVVERGGTDSNYLQTPTDPNSGVAQAEVSFVVTQTALTIASIRDSTGATIPNDGVATAVMFGNSGTAPDIDYASLFTGSYQPQYLALFMTDEYGNLINSNAARGEPEPSFAARERVHWVKYNMNADGSGGVEGRNAAGGNGYLGLSARDGQLHPYYIVVYGYDATVTPASDSAQDIYNAVKAAAAAEARFYMYQDRPDPVATITAEVGADGKVYESQPDFTITWDSSADIKAGDHLILSADGTPFVTLTLAASDITAGQIVYDNNSTLSLAVGSTVTISSLVVRDGFDSNYLTDLNNPASGVMQSEVEVVRDTETVTIPEITDGSGSITSHQGLASSGFASSSSPPSIDYSAINNLFQHTRDAASYYAVLLIDEYGNIVNSQGLEGAPAPGGGDEEYLWSRYNIAADGSGGVDLKAYAALQPPDGEQHSYYLVVVGYQQQVNSTPADSQALYDLIKDSATGFAYLYMYQDRPDPVASIATESGNTQLAEFQPRLVISIANGSDIAVGDRISISNATEEIISHIVTAADISSGRIVITRSSYLTDKGLATIGIHTLTSQVSRNQLSSDYLRNPLDPASRVTQAEITIERIINQLSLNQITTPSGTVLRANQAFDAGMNSNAGNPSIDIAAVIPNVSERPVYYALVIVDENGDNSDASENSQNNILGDSAHERLVFVQLNINGRDGSGGFIAMNSFGVNGYSPPAYTDGREHHYNVYVIGYYREVGASTSSISDIINWLTTYKTHEGQMQLTNDRPDPARVLSATNPDGSTSIGSLVPTFTVSWDSSSDIKIGDVLELTTATGDIFARVTITANMVAANSATIDFSNYLNDYKFSIGQNTVTSRIIRNGSDSRYRIDPQDPDRTAAQAEATFNVEDRYWSVTETKTRLAVISGDDAEVVLVYKFNKSVHGNEPGISELTGSITEEQIRSSTTTLSSDGKTLTVSYLIDRNYQGQLTQSLFWSRFTDANGNPIELDFDQDRTVINIFDIDFPPFIPAPPEVFTNYTQPSEYSAPTFFTATLNSLTEDALLIRNPYNLLIPEQLSYLEPAIGRIWQFNILDISEKNIDDFTRIKFIAPPRDVIHSGILDNLANFNIRPNPFSVFMAIIIDKSNLLPPGSNTITGFLFTSYFATSSLSLQKAILSSGDLINEAIGAYRITGYQVNYNNNERIEFSLPQSNTDTAITRLASTTNAAIARPNYQDNSEGNTLKLQRNLADLT